MALRLSQVALLAPIDLLLSSFAYFTLSSAAFIRIVVFFYSFFAFCAQNFCRIENHILRERID